MPPFKLALGVALVANAVSSLAADFQFADGVQASVKTTLTAGTIIRTASPSPDNYALIPSSVVTGATPGTLVGQTGGSDLNYAKNRPTTALVKGMVDIDLHGKNLGLFVRGDAWYDFVNGHKDVAYGNYSNGFTPNAPLSDDGQAQDAKFSALRFRDVYIYGNVDAGSDMKLEAKLGRQVLNWGVSQFFNGGIGGATNPIDLAAQVRPGALPQESKVPLGMLSLTLTSGQAWALDGWAAYEFRSSNVPACGTFFDGASIVQPGCNMSAAVGAPIAGTPLATIASLTEHSLLASGYYIHRDPNGGMAKNSGQYGLSARFAVAPLNTEFRVYAATSHNTAPNIYSVKIENINGATLPAGLAGGLGRLTNPNGMRYSVLFPESTHMFGLSFDTKLNPAARVFGEIAYRPNQPIGMSPIDLLTASLLRAPTSLLATQTGILAVPAGGTFDAYDRFKVITANLGGNLVIPKALGADRIVLAGELGINHVNGLPDPSVMRYGRGLAYGAAPYMLNGALTACSESAPGLNGVPGKTCSYGGFVSSNSWGLRGRVAATYGNAVAGAALTPSLLIAKDIKGWSYDGTYNEGRLTARLGLRADWGTRYFGEVAYTYMGGGDYNPLSDRSNLALVAGMSF